MDWQHLIKQFKLINSSETPSFAPPNEKTQAIASYNRAITNLNSQNGDIAMITLRKLAATYPAFSQAVLLHGICLAANNRLDESYGLISQAIRNGLAEPYLGHAETVLTELDRAISQRSQTQSLNSTIRSHGDRKNLAAPQPAPRKVLEKPGRHSKVRMASEKERQAVIRRGEFAQEQETNVRDERHPVEYLRIAIPALAILIVVGLLIFFGIKLVTDLADTNRRQLDTETRLDWLLTRLDGLAGSNTAIASLLDDYEVEFAPTTAATTVATTAATTLPTTQVTTKASDATTAPTTANTTATTREPTTTLAESTKLSEANNLLQLATVSQSSDLLTAGNQLLAARTLLAAIPTTTIAPDVTGDAAALSASVEALITTIGENAAEKNRQLGMADFNLEKYDTALPYFLTAYQLYPRSYGGGAAYYCGYSYQKLGNFESAKPYYDYVIQTFAGKQIATYAKSRLNEIGY